MINVAAKRENSNGTSIPMLLSGRFRWSTAVQRLKETNRRAERGVGTVGVDDEPSPVVLWGEDDKP